jgi:hypothetical protein
MHAEYQHIRGRPHGPPSNRPLYVGTIAGPVLPHIERSARQARERIARHGE